MFLYSEEDIEGIPNIRNLTFKKPTTQPTINTAETAILKLIYSE